PEYARRASLNILEAVTKILEKKIAKLEPANGKTSSPVERIVLIIGPSAVGKSPLLNAVLNQYADKFEKLILYTSRGVRPGEKEGEDYYFTTKDEMHRRESQTPGLFLTMPVHGDILQGIDLATVEGALAKHKVLLGIVSTDLADLLRKHYPEGIVTIFVSPLSEARIEQLSRKWHQSKDTVIFRTMLNRQNERSREIPMPRDKRIQRAKSAVAEMARRNDFDAVIVNDALHDIREDAPRWQGAEGKALVEQFMTAINPYLSYKSSSPVDETYQVFEVSTHDIKTNVVSAGLAYRVAAGDGIFDLRLGNKAKEYLEKLMSNDTSGVEADIIIPPGASISINDQLLLDFPSIIRICGRTDVKFTQPQGPIIVANIESLPMWYERFSQESFPHIWHEIEGFNRTGLIFDGPAVVAYDLSRKRFSWDKSVPAEWLMDSVTYGGEIAPATGVSFVHYNMPEQGADFYRHRQKEFWHLHPVIDGLKEMAEFYMLTSGAGQILFQVGNEFYLATLGPNSLVLMRPEVRHAVVRGAGNYWHMVLQFPSAHHYGFTFSHKLMTMEELYDSHRGLHGSILATDINKTGIEKLSIKSSSPITDALANLIAEGAFESWFNGLSDTRVNVLLYGYGIPEDRKFVHLVGKDLRKVGGLYDLKRAKRIAGLTGTDITDYVSNNGYFSYAAQLLEKAGEGLPETTVLTDALRQIIQSNDKGEDIIREKERIFDSFLNAITTFSRAHDFIWAKEDAASREGFDTSAEFFHRRAEELHTKAGNKYERNGLVKTFTGYTLVSWVYDNALLAKLVSFTDALKLAIERESPSLSQKLAWLLASGTYPETAHMTGFDIGVMADNKAADIREGTRKAFGNLAGIPAIQAEINGAVIVGAISIVVRVNIKTLESLEAIRDIRWAMFGHLKHLNLYRFPEDPQKFNAHITLAYIVDDIKGNAYKALKRVMQTFEQALIEPNYIVNQFELRRFETMQDWGPVQETLRLGETSETPSSSPMEENARTSSYAYFSQNMDKLLLFLAAVARLRIRLDKDYLDGLCDLVNSENLARLEKTITPEFILSFKYLLPQMRSIVTAAGLGTRMPDPSKSKILYEANGRPVIFWTLDTIRWLDERPVVVVRAQNYKDALGAAYEGGNRKEIEEALDNSGYEAEYVEQDYLKGDGYAVKQAIKNSSLNNYEGSVLIIWGDIATIHPLKILALAVLHAVKDASLSIATTIKENPYAPIIEDEQGRVLGGKKGMAVPFGKDDAGVFIGKTQELLQALEDYPKDESGNYFNPLDNRLNKKGEMNFVQISTLLTRSGKIVIAPAIIDKEECVGVDTPEKLESAASYLKNNPKPNLSHNSSSPVIYSHGILEGWNLRLLDAGHIEADVRFYYGNSLIGGGTLDLDAIAASIHTCRFKSYAGGQYIAQEMAARIYLRAYEISALLNLGTKYAHAFYTLSLSEEREAELGGINYSRVERLYRIFTRLGLKRQALAGKEHLNGLYGRYNDHLALLEDTVNYCRNNWREWFYKNRFEKMFKEGSWDKVYPGIDWQKAEEERSKNDRASRYAIERALVNFNIQPLRNINKGLGLPSVAGGDLVAAAADLNSYRSSSPVDFNNIGELPGYSVRMGALDLPAMMDCKGYVESWYPELRPADTPSDVEDILQRKFVELDAHNAVEGDLVVYFNRDGSIPHFGIIFKDGRVESKFNEGGVYLHPAESVPVEYGSPRYFRRNEASSSPVMRGLGAEQSKLIEITLDKGDIGRKTFKVVLSAESVQDRIKEAAVAIYDLLAVNQAFQIAIRCPSSDYAEILKAFYQIDEKGVIRQRVKTLFGRPLEFTHAFSSVAHVDVPDRILWRLEHQPRFNPKDIFVGLNIGSTYTRCLVMKDQKVIAQSSKILWSPERSHRNWARPETYNEFISGIENFVRETIGNAGLRLTDIKAIGVGTVGLVKDGRVLTPANITRALSEEDFAKVADMRQDLSRRLDGIPVYIEMDNKVAALGERFISDTKDALVVKLGTSMGGKIILPSGNITDNFEEIRQIIVDTSADALAQSHTAVKGTLRSYATAEGIEALAQRVMGKPIAYSELVSLLYSPAPQEARQVFELSGAYLARGLVKLHRIFDNRRVILSGKNLEGVQGDIIIGAIMKTLHAEYPGIDLEVKKSGTEADYLVAAGAAYLAGFAHLQTEEHALLAKLYRLTSTESADVRSIEEHFGVEVLPRSKALQLYICGLTNNAIDIKQRLIAPNLLVSGNPFGILRENLMLMGRQVVWRAIQQARSARVKNVIRTIRENNIRSALKQQRDSIDLAHMYEGRNPQLVHRLSRALDKLFNIKEKYVGYYYSEEYLRNPKMSVEVYSGVNVVDGLKTLKDIFYALLDRLFGVSRRIREIVKLEEELGVRRKGDEYRLKFFRRNNQAREFLIDPYTEFVMPQRQAVSLRAGTRILRDRIMARLNSNPALPVVVRIDGRPGNRKSHSINLLKEDLRGQISEDEICLIEVNDYKKPDIWLYDAEALNRDFEKIYSSGKYKVILIEGTVIELYKTGSLPRGDITLYIESSEQRRMEYLLNGEDKERLEYFLRFYQYHNILLRYQVDPVRQRADIVMNTYLIPGERVTSLKEDLSLSELARELSYNAHFLLNEMDTSIINEHDAVTITARQNIIASALNKLLDMSMVSPAQKIRLNLFTNHGIIAAHDDTEIGLWHGLLTDDRFSPEERQSVLIFYLYLLIRNKELNITNLEGEPIKRNFLVETTVLYQFFIELFSHQFIAEKTRFDWQACLSGLQKIGIDQEQLDRFLDISRMTITERDRSKILSAIFGYISRYNQTFSQNLYTVNLKNVDVVGLVDIIGKTLDRASSSSPIEDKKALSKYNIAEYYGPLDEELGLRFTFATLQINPEDLESKETKDPASLRDDAASFVREVFSVMQDRGAHPKFALSILGLPATLYINTIQELLGAIVEETDKFAVPVVGGHTIESDDLIYTLILIEIIPASNLPKIEQTRVSISNETADHPIASKDLLVTSYRGQGCAAKYPPDKLDRILSAAISRLPSEQFGDLHANEDVVLYRLSDTKSVAFTVDIIKPIVNVAGVFSRIAMGHAANDLYAKGIKPHGAVEIMFDGPAHVSLAVNQKIHSAGLQEINRMQSAYLGSYEAESRQLFYGALLYGLCSPQEFISNYGVRLGDTLILTKPLGSGTISTYVALKGYDLSAEETESYLRMIDLLSQSNEEASRIIRAVGVNACTDVTGFGLIGHLREMLDEKGLSARIWLEKVPFIQGAVDYCRRIGQILCSVNRNQHYLSLFVAEPEDTPELRLLYDAQTAGGLLISVAREKAEYLLERLHQAGIPAVSIGEIIEERKPLIEVVDSRASSPIHAKRRLAIFDLDGTVYPADVLRDQHAVLREKFIAQEFGVDIHAAKEMIEQIKEKHRIVDTDHIIRAMNLDLHLFNRFKDAQDFDPRRYLAPNERLRNTLSAMAEDFVFTLFTHNTLKLAKLTLEGVAILEYFAGHIYVYDQWRIMKPDPLVFQRLAEIFGMTDYQNCISIGDRYHVDISTPKQLGMKILHVTGPQDITLEAIHKAFGISSSPLNTDDSQWDKWISKPVTMKDLNPDMFRDYDFRSTGP
ncbi:MAG: selenide, water dikinase SelD, partial [Deltaproteobacteria bacterium]